MNILGDLSIGRNLSAYGNLLVPEINGGALISHTLSLYNNSVNKTGVIIQANGSLSVNTTAYENLVTTDNIIPNKKYVDDAVAGAGGGSWETSTSNIKMDGTVSVGVLSTMARADHIHPSDTSKVSTTGDETVAGIKTFSSFPVTPSSAPTTNYQVANKKYVDDNAGGVSLSPFLLMGC